MKKTWKVLCTLFVAITLFAGLTACGGKNDSTEEEQTSTTDQAAMEQDNPDYDVEDDLVEGILTEDMLDEMAEEEATTEEEKKDEEAKKDPTANLKKYYIKVNRKTNVITVYTYDENGNYTKPVKAFVCSVGKSSSPTPTGKFKISTKHRWQLMKGDVYSQYCSRITGHILFHSVPYRETKSNTLFASYYDKLGRAASSGCVRMTCGDALWIYSNCPSGTVVEIFDGSSANDPLGKPGAMKVSGTAYSTWDPTDPVSNNPWKTAKPVITVSSFNVELGSGNVDLAAKATVKDAYGNALTPTISGNVDTNKIGTYSVTYSAKDSRGNSAKTTITVTVKDTTAPVIKWNLNHYKYEGTRDSDSIKAYVKKNISVNELSNEYTVTVSAPNVNEKKGTIECTVIAKDGLKNTSAPFVVKLTFEVDQSSSEGSTSTGETPPATPESTTGTSATTTATESTTGTSATTTATESTTGTSATTTATESTTGTSATTNGTE